MFAGKGFTKKLYEKLRQEVGWETKPIDGWIFHAASFDESGDIHRINVWESIEKMEEGFASRLVPAMKKLGIPKPEVEIYTTHNVNVFKTGNQT